MSGRLRVAFLDHSSRPGGGQLGLRRFLERSNAGFDRDLVVIEGGPLSDWARRQGINVHEVFSEGERPRLQRRRKALTRLLGRIDADVIVANSLSAAMILSLTPKRGRTFVYYLREDLSPRSVTGLKRFFILTFALTRFDAFLANSRWTASTLPARYLRRPWRVAYPISGVHEKDELQADSHKLTGPLRILSLSRLSPWKGIDVLVHAMQILHSRGPGRFEATIAGEDLFATEGEYAFWLRGEAASVSDAVKFIGHTDDVDAEIARHDVLVSNSRLPEPFGQVIIQGMSGGLITVATAQGGPTEIIDDGVNGYLVPPDNPTALADRLEAIREDRDSSRMRRKSIIRANMFSDERTGPALEAAILEVVGEARNR